MDGATVVHLDRQIGRQRGRVGHAVSLRGHDGG